MKDFWGIKLGEKRSEDRPLRGRFSKERTSEDGDTNWRPWPEMHSTRGPRCPGTHPSLPTTSECRTDLTPAPFPPATSPAPILLIPHIRDFKSIQDPPTDCLHAHLNSSEFLLQVVLSLQYWSLIASKTFQCHVLFACLFVSLNHD